MKKLLLYFQHLVLLYHLSLLLRLLKHGVVLRLQKETHAQPRKQPTNDEGYYRYDYIHSNHLTNNLRFIYLYTKKALPSHGLTVQSSAETLFLQYVCYFFRYPSNSVVSSCILSVKGFVSFRFSNSRLCIES